MFNNALIAAFFVRSSGMSESPESSSAAALSQHNDRGVRWPLWAAGGAAALASVVLGGLSWFGSRLLLKPQAGSRLRQAVFELQIVEATRTGGAQGRVAIEGLPALRSGWWGLRTPSSFLQIGPVRQTLGVTGGRAVRPYRLLTGRHPRGGDAGRLDGYVFPDDPAVLGCEWDNLQIESEVGDMPAWRIDPPEGTFHGGAALLIHGRGSTRAQTLRVADVLTQQGWRCYCVSYRNDPWAVASPSGLYRLGQTEWKDVDAAARRALDDGAQRLLPVGWSMGGGITMSWLRNSKMARHAQGVVLDAPVLDWGPVIRHAASNRVLSWLVPWLMLWTGWRHQIEYEALNHLQAADMLDVPVLLYHGADDPVVPVDLSDALAGLRPDIVEYERFEDAGHTTCWNTNRERYDMALQRFIRQLPDSPASRPEQVPVPAEQDPADVGASDAFGSDEDVAA